MNRLSGLARLFTRTPRWKDDGKKKNNDDIPPLPVQPTLPQPQLTNNIPNPNMLKNNLFSKIGALGGGAGGLGTGGGIPCKFELTMEFVCYFIFTFIIYFCVFAFFPYDGIITKVVNFIEKVFKKTIDFFYGLVPKPVKKRASKLFPSFIVKFFKETLPNALRERKDEEVSSLKKRLDEIKNETDKKINKNKKKANKEGGGGVALYFNEQYLKITQKLKILWEKFKDKIIPAIIVSFIYYVIWFIFFKVIPPIFKYFISMAQQFSHP